MNHHPAARFPGSAGEHDLSALRPERAMGPVNWIGFWTLYIKEVQRFLKVFTQTIIAPAVTTLLFLAVFSLAFGGATRHMGAVPYLAFLAPGLIMMAIVQNAFSNTASSLLISKVQGNIVDVLMPPISPGELTTAYALAGLTRGLVVGVVVALAMLPFTPLRILHPGVVIYFAVAASLMLSLVGLIGGLWADKFDHMAAVTNFVITPLSFLSGTFYSVHQLPTLWYHISLADPFFFMIDGFRYGFIGQSDANLWRSGVALAAIDLVLWIASHLLIRAGYKLKA